MTVTPTTDTYTFAYLVSSDMERFTNSMDPWWKAFHRGFQRPGLWASLFIRSQQRLVERGFWHLGGMLRGIGIVLLGIDISAGAKFGPGLMIEHPGGVTIGPLVVVGSNVTIHQGVDIGVKDPRARGDMPYPVIGDDVVLGSRSAVYGDVRVGDGALVGAYSVVFKDVEPGATVAGIPAKVLKR